MNPVTREQHKQYCLRKLGKPAIKINVTDEQLEDRIDESLQEFMDWHFQASEKTYLVHQMTASEIDTGEIILPNNILYVINMLPLTSSSQGNQLSYQWQFEASAYYTLQDAAGGLTDYVLTKQKLSQLRAMLNPEKIIEYNRHSNKLKIMSELSELSEGDYIALYVHAMIDPDTVGDLWDNQWLKRYTTQLFKEQWGSNLGKFVNVELLGGVTFNGEQIYSQAREEIEKLEEKLRTEYSLPVHPLYTA